MRILLVEDDPLIGSAVRDHIVAAGHAVDWAATLDEAAAHARVAEFGLIILDLAMPETATVLHFCAPCAPAARPRR